MSGPELWPNLICTVLHAQNIFTWSNSAQRLRFEGVHFYSDRESVLP